MNDKLSRSQLLERLVDGELPPDEYRALLTSLDEEPAGWRECALAFLEAQAMGRELVAVRAGELTRPAKETATATTAKPRTASSGAAATTLAGNAKLFLAVAASFLVAFTLGVTVPYLDQTSWLVFRPTNTSLPGVSGAGQIADETPLLSPQWAAPDRTRGAGSPEQIGNVRLVVNGPNDTTTDAGELPVYDLSEETAHLVNQQAIPDWAIREMHRRGLQINRSQEYVPVEMEDGRQLILPVESYQITPVSRRPY